MRNLISSLFKNNQLETKNNYGLQGLMNVINYHYKNSNLLLAAITHTSVSGKEGVTSRFERMEFLGDSILGLIIAEKVFEKFPDYSEGQLSKLRAKIVSRDFLATVARQIGLGNYLVLSREAENSGGRENNSILADAMESLICSIYLDSGIKAARKFIQNFIFRSYKTILDEQDLINYKSKLQEYTQLETQDLPEYVLVEESGPDHLKIFVIEVKIHGKTIGKGKGYTKKEAQQKAAKVACQTLHI